MDLNAEQNCGYSYFGQRNVSAGFEGGGDILKFREANPELGSGKIQHQQ